MNETSLPSAGRTAWLMVALLVPVALLNYLDRQMLATMKASMVADIPSIANKADWGIVLGSFKWVYAALSPIGGYIADRFSRRHVISFSLLAWSLVTWWTGHVGSFHELVAARALMGVSEAFYIPAALALITDFHLGRTRSRAVGLHQTGIYIGLILGGFAGYVAESPSLGWTWAFSAAGIVGVVYAFPLFFLLKNPPRPAAADGSLVAGPSPLAALGSLLGNRHFILLVLYFTLPAIAGWVVRDWMPEVVRERYGLSQGDAGLSAVLSVQIASILGSLLGGWTADRWMRRTHRGRIYASAIGMVLFLPALIGVGRSETVVFAVSFLVLFGIGWGFFDTNNMPILSQIARPELRATGYGLMNFVSISAGGFADWSFGHLRDQKVAHSTIFDTFAGIALLSVVIVLLIRPRGADAGREEAQ
ncbi:MAG: MFS transporter [Verrucomicrobiales bacterium]|nr:MFS transporter [Verrucomicrobiales bacterium]